MTHFHFLCLVPVAPPLPMPPSTVTRALGVTALPLILLVLSLSLASLQTTQPILSLHKPPGQSHGWIPSLPLDFDSGRHPHRVDLLPLGRWTPSTASPLAPRLSLLPIPQQILPEVQRVVGHQQESLRGCPHSLTLPGDLPLTCLLCHWRKSQLACGLLAYQRQRCPCSKGSESMAACWCSWLKISCHMTSTWADSMWPRSHNSYRAGGPKSNIHTVLRMCLLAAEPPWMCLPLWPTGCWAQWMKLKETTPHCGQTVELTLDWL